MVRGFYVQNFGCRATQSDGAALERQFEERGLERRLAPGQAEIVIFNTCTVTASADQDARAAIRRVHRENPTAEIIVTGCYAQRAPEELASLPGVRRVIGNSHKHELARIALGERPQTAPRTSETTGGFVTVASLSGGRSATPDLPPAPGQQSSSNDQPPIFVSDIFAHTDFVSAPVCDAANERTRPNLKVQDGCDNRCSFCVIPYVRGQSRSLGLERVVEEVNGLVAGGYREVVISGINLGRWEERSALPVFTSQKSGLNRHPSAPSVPQAATDPGSARGLVALTTDERRPATLVLRLTALIRAILERTEIEKLRISSVEPMDWTDELIALVAQSERIAKHAHVPMQSGSDAVLRRMHRKYRPWHYREKIEKIHAAMPVAAIGADVMVGFPGESDAEFEETRRMVEELPFAYLHVFPYSARPGTPAASLRKQVPASVAGERGRILRELAAHKKTSYMRSFVGTMVEAITLREESGASSGGMTKALTDNYLKLMVEGRHEANQWIRVRVEGVASDALVGQVAGGRPRLPCASPLSPSLPS